ncbi:putative bifunctional diguanylate cyclase/phosphodiesterase [Aquipuribacter sp. SD81]|uniref:putative bifunctional diguanylate cyclase/phosphodiesterase n=1 Tax=Aquipuribacter sp. SD81 TaxID=3127703 RepID=UPI003017F254
MRLLEVGLALGWLGVAAVLLLRPLPPASGAVVSYVVQCATVLAAAAVMAVRARQARGAFRRARALLAACLVVTAAAGVLATVIRLAHDGDPPVPSLADVVHFAFLPLCVAGLLCYPLRDDDEGSWTRVLLDGVVAASALWFVLWTVLLEPAGVGGLPLATLVTAVGYPATDVLVAATAAGMMLRVAPRARRELTLIAAGVTAYGVSDVAYTVLTVQGAYRPDSWVGVLAEGGILLLLLAAVRADASPRAVADGGEGSAWWACVPYLAVLAAIVTGSSAAVVRGQLDASAVLLAAVLVTAMLARQLVAHRDRGGALRRVRESRALFRSLVVSSSDLITLHDVDGTIRWSSPAVTTLTGLDLEDLRRTHPRELLHPDDVAVVRDLRRALTADPGEPGRVHVRLRAADGSWRWCESVVRNLLDEPGVAGVVCNTRDVHESYVLAERLRHDASHDSLTGLPNLAAARAELRRVHEAGADPVPVVAMVDLDGFKEVNDTFGHLVGDRLLVAVAGAVRGCVRAPDLVARVGGDEFVLVLHDAAAAEGVARRVLEALRRPMSVAGRPLAVRASIGLAPLHADGPEATLRDADLAMYAAKEAGRDRLVWAHPSMHEAAAARAEIVAELRQVLDAGGLTLHYQPIVDLADGSLSGVEALLRWFREDGSAVPPDVFVPVAEATGLMTAVDEWVLDHACADLAAWRRGGADVPQVSVNVSRRHLTVGLPALVAASLARHGLTGADLCLEVTESAVAPDPATAVAVLEAVRATGVRVALDDFGTGQSSLSQLADLPVDVVKIDKSFVARSEAEGGRQLLRSVLAMCRALGLRVVVEGVEDLATLPALRADGCHLGQGYALGRPSPAHVVAGRARADDGVAVAPLG